MPTDTTPQPTGEDAELVAEAREPPEVEEALLGQLRRAADGGYDYSRTKGLCDRAATLIASLGWTCVPVMERTAATISTNAALACPTPPTTEAGR